MYPSSLTVLWPSSLRNAEVYIALYLCHPLLIVLHTEITPDERAKLLETTSLFADIHAAAATAGQTEVPHNLDTDLHFTCFVESAHKDGTGSRVIELDGRRKGPVDRGQCTNLLTVGLGCS